MVTAPIKSIVKINGHAVQLRVVVTCAIKHQAALLLLRYFNVIAQIALVGMYNSRGGGLAK